MAGEEPLASALQRGDDAALAVPRQLHPNDFYEEPSRGLKLNGSSPFDSWFVIDKDGALRAEYPKLRPGLLGKDYAWRDYFQERGGWPNSPRPPST